MVKVIRKIKEYIKFIIFFKRYITKILYGINNIDSALNIDRFDISIDEKTPRLNCININKEPILEGLGDHSWRGAIFDGRFVTKNIIYYCAQQSYDPKSGLVIGRAELNDNIYKPDDYPCIYKTEETYGIDIPTFFTFEGQISCIYFDNFGPERINDNRNRNLVVCQSKDGKHFTKRILHTPLRKYIHKNVGLPFIENVEGELYITVRARNIVRNIVSRAKFDIRTGMTTEWKHIELPHDPINVSTITLNKAIHLFHGTTTGSGFYIKTLDAKTFTTSSDFMLVDPDHNPWGWDMRKICASPYIDGNRIMFSYLGYTNSNNLKIGLCTMDLKNLPIIK